MTAPEAIAGAGIAIIAALVMFPALQDLAWPEGLRTLAAAFTVLP